MPSLVSRFATPLPHVCLLLAILAPVAVIAIIATASAESLAMGLDLSVRMHAQMEFGWERRFIAALIALVPVSCLSYALLKARDSLKRFNSGEYFSASAIAGIRGFGAGIFWSGLLTLVLAPIAIFALTGRNVLRLDMSTLVMLTVGGILWQIASTMQRAAEIAEENRQFI